MFQVTSTVSFSDGRPSVVRSWTDLVKVHVVEHLEAALIHTLQKMNALSADIGKGKAPKMQTANPVTVTWDATVTEDGNLWASNVATWPGMGDEQVAWFLGLLDGELSHVDRTVKSRENKK
jgi:hypothetical protein